MKNATQPWPGSTIFSALDISFDDIRLWINDVFTPTYRKEVEAYLAESVDIYDLERRVRMLQRRGMI
jgi:hypothetical protein